MLTAKTILPITVSVKKIKGAACCDMDQNDTIGKIELCPLIVLSTRVTNWKNDIHKFLQQFEWSWVNRDSNSHLKVLGAKQTVEWQFTH